MSPAPDSPWYRRVDPWGPLLALVSLGIFLLHGYGGELTRDLALYSYSGQQVAEGVAPYVSVLNRAGPLAHLVPGIGALLARGLGTDDVMTMRVLMTVLSVVSVWLLYVAGRDLFRSRLAGAASAATLLVCQGFVIYATGGPREKTTVVLLVVLALWAIVHRRWAAAGVAVALATLTWQPAFLVGTSVAGVAMLGFPFRDLLRALLRFCLAGLLTAAAFVVGFALAGALDDFIDCFLLINARYTNQTGLIGYLRTDAGDLHHGFGWSLWVMLAGLLATLLVAAARVVGLRRDDHLVMVQVGLGTATAVATVWSFVVAFNGWADLMFVVPLAALGLGGGVTLLVGLLAARRTSLRVPLLAGLTTVGLVAAAVNSWATAPDIFPQQRRQVAAVMAAAPDDATIASVGAPQPLVLTGRRNPNPYQMFLAGFNDYFEATYPGGMQGIADLIAGEKPTLITADHPEWYYWLRPTLSRDYTELGVSTDFTWFARNDIGPAGIERLRQAVARTR